MDVQMPGMNGLDATAAIRALGGSRLTMPIVAMTANAMDGDRETLLAAGMSDYISKPFSMSQLAAMMDTWRHRLEKT
jgi:CheY-like chemotaxis protein